MDAEDRARIEREVHERMTGELRKALRERDALSAAEALCRTWEEAHRARHDNIKRLKAEIQRAEAHFRYEEAERLRQQLAAT